MTGAVLSALASHWQRNRLQLLTLVVGLALATALWSGVQAINAEARASYDAAAATLAEGRFDQLVPQQGDSIAQELFVRLRRAGWLVSPVVEGRLRVGNTDLRLAVQAEPKRHVQPDQSRRHLRQVGFSALGEGDQDGTRAVAL